MIISVLVWRKSIHFWRRYEQKTIFIFSFPVHGMGLWPLDIKFVPPIQRYVFTKFLALFSRVEKIEYMSRRTDRQTDGRSWRTGVQHLTRSPRDGRITNSEQSSFDTAVHGHHQWLGEILSATQQMLRSNLAFSGIFWCVLYIRLFLKRNKDNTGWWRGLAVTRWSRSTKLP